MNMTEEMYCNCDQDEIEEDLMTERDWKVIEEMYCNCDQDEIEEDLMCVD